MIDVLEQGVQTTIQDGGRPGYLSRGMAPAGAQDRYAIAFASLLVGNRVPPPLFTLDDPGDAALEMLLIGPTLRFRQERVVAVTGAEMTPTVDGEPIPLWTSVTVPAGATLSLGQARRGARGYLAVSGGFDVPPYLGSRSTFVRGSQGGHEGRALRKGDVLALGPERRPAAEVSGRSVPPELVPDFPQPWELRVVPGPQDHLFTEEARALFYSSDWTLSPVSDRMGFRLQGPPLTLEERPPHLFRDAGSGPADIVDDVIPVGGIQVPGGVEAIILGVENPTVGGYAKIATLISADLGRIGQMRPGEAARFTAVDAEEAVRIGVEQDDSINEDALVAS